MSDSRAIDRESRRRIHEELLENILVEAGAGSGKTQMLAERMAAGVANGVYEVEHMAAVTFTRKAASELRGRFQLALENKLRELERNPDPGSGVPAAERVHRERAANGCPRRTLPSTCPSRTRRSYSRVPRRCQRRVR